MKKSSRDDSEIKERTGSIFEARRSIRRGTDAGKTADYSISVANQARQNQCNKMKLYKKWFIDAKIYSKSCVALANKFYWSIGMVMPVRKVLVFRLVQEVSLHRCNLSVLFDKPGPAQVGATSKAQK